ncbi:MAG: outer membrane protein assembly factor BamE [Motiliproteus sp.]|nr:outer membrane protein assembly factor BamE [Motiliproteus sp.]MCW9052603.1 outer membrane protein assembly factor BamE [Motiliproteus sp.]
MLRILITTVLLVLIAGCSYFPGVHKIDIQQGNLVTQEMVDQLRPGMTKSQVRFVMGSPLVVDTFQQSRWDYLMTLKKGTDDVRIQERISLFFKEGKLAFFNGDFRPSAANVQR